MARGRRHWAIGRLLSSQCNFYKLTDRVKYKNIFFRIWSFFIRKWYENIKIGKVHLLNLRIAKLNMLSLTTWEMFVILNIHRHRHTSVHRTQSFSLNSPSVSQYHWGSSSGIFLRVKSGILVKIWRIYFYKWTPGMQ